LEFEGFALSELEFLVRLGRSLLEVVKFHIGFLSFQSFQLLTVASNHQRGHLSRKEL